MAAKKQHLVSKYPCDYIVIQVKQNEFENLQFVHEILKKQ